MQYLIAAFLFFSISSYCQADSNIELNYNTQRAGGDYTNFEVRDVDKCSRQCERDSRCLAFDFDTYSRQCYLKDRVHQPRNNPSVISGVKNQYGGNHSYLPNTIAGLQIGNNIKLNGGDYTHFTVGSVEECARACSRDNRCWSFNYGKQQRDCWLKNSVPNGVPNNTVISGAKQGYASAGGAQQHLPAMVPGIRLEDNVKRNGGDYTHFTVGNVGECAMACSRDNKCRSFNYGKQQRDCWLKNSVPNGVFNNTVVSGVKGR